MFFGNETDRFLKRFFSDPFGFETDDCNGFCYGADNKEESAVPLRNNPSVKYYGFIATMGPDGRPIVHEYGNAGPAERQLQRERYLKPVMPSSDTKEPLVDTIVDEKAKVVKFIAEIPGVEKRDIKITVDGGRHVSVSTGNHGGKKYQMRIPLEHKVNESSARATYRNGILQITFSMVEGSRGAKTIKID